MIGFVEIAEFTAEALLAPAAAVLIFTMEKKGYFARIKPVIRSILIGVVFGILAIIGTEYGIPVNGAQVNCRDAAVLTAGLIFGPAAGMFSALIGGVERWFAISRGIGTYTGVACTIATFVSGVVSALVSRFMLEERKPTMGMALFIGVSVEVFHLMLVCALHMDDMKIAMDVVQSIVYPMVLGNGLSVLLSTAAILFLSGNLDPHRKQSETPVFETILKGMMAVIFVFLVVMCLFVARLESIVSETYVTKLMEGAVSDAASELDEQVNRYMIERCEQVKKDLNEGSYTLQELAEKYEISEVYLVNKQGIVTDCSQSLYRNYDMSKGAQSSEFMCLLHGKAQFVQEYETLSVNQDLQRKSAGIATSDGFLMISYDADGIYNVVKNRISGIATNRHVGQNGSIVILEMNAKVVSYSSDLSIREINAFLYNRETDSESVGLGGVSESTYNAAIGDLASKTIEIGTIEYYYYLQESSGYEIYALYPVEEAQLQENITIYVTIFQIIIIFMALYVLLYIIVKKSVMDQVVRIADSLDEISSGNLDVVVDVNSSAEFTSLSKDINGTVNTLKRYIDEASARIDEELKMAADIQLGVLPNPETAFRNRRDFEIYAKMDPAREVGGDFFDFYFTNEDEMNIMIADVSGKGIPAAMFMMRAKSTLRDLTESGRDVNEVFTEANNSLCTGNDAEMFVTAWQARIHLDTGTVEFANAGHNPPLIKHGNRPFTFIENTRNPILGAIEDVPYRKGSLKLRPGDILLLYTDGVVEATNGAEELYGEQRLLKVLNSGSYSTMKELLMMIRSDVDSFVGEAPQFDDLTMLAFRYNGKEKV